jgi:putative membrane protein
MMRHHFMYPYHWVLLAVALVLLIAGIVYLVRWQSKRGDRKTAPGDPTSLDQLRKSYARGEISRQEYEQRKNTLK